MYLLNILKSIFEVESSKPELNKARYGALAKQIPLMYVIVIVNMYALAYTHLPYAPFYLALSLPALLTPIAVCRSIFILSTNTDELTDIQIVNRLKAINYTSFAIGSLGFIWAASLFKYGNAFTQSHTALFVSLTAVGAVSCLMHHYQSALIIAAVTVVPSIMFLIFQENPIFSAIAINILLVVGAMLFIMFRNYIGFTDLIENQKKLQQQSKIMEILGSENRRLANLDTLSMLANRRSFFAKLNSIIHDREITKYPFVVGVLDLDGFKRINDLFGHPVGDQLLVDTSNRLRDLLHEDIFLARLGGDEFGIIFPNPETEQDVLTIGNQICEALQVPFEMKEGTAKIACTLGLATFPTAGTTAEVLFERADYALYYSKQNSKGTVVMFSKEHETVIREVSAIAHRLREADLCEELSVVFQPIINAKTNEIFSFEALARWESDVLGCIPPNVFIRSAEQSGMISQLTHILFQKTLDNAARWPDHTNFSFNLSTFDLCSHQSILRLLDVVNQSGISPKRITFEITETTVMQDYERAIEGLTLLRNLGCQIALDDFGTGFSSLSYIQHLPIDRVKIDRAFIKDLETSETTKKIVSTLAYMCENLGLECVVEGVETTHQLNIVEQMGLNIIQGYYFSKPLSPQETLDYIQNADPQALTKAS